LALPNEEALDEMAVSFVQMRKVKSVHRIRNGRAAAAKNKTKKQSSQLVSTGSRLSKL